LTETDWAMAYAISLKGDKECYSNEWTFAGCCEARLIASSIESSKFAYEELGIF